MKLAQEIIIYHLKKMFAVADIHVSKKTRKFDVPVLYSPELQNPGHVLVGQEDMLCQYIRDPRIFEENLLIFVHRQDSPHPDFSGAVPCLLLKAENDSFFQIFNRIQEIFLKFNQWDEEMKDTVLNQKGYDALVKCSEAIITAPFGIINKGMKCIACSEYYYQFYAAPNNMQRHGFLPWKYTNDTAVRKKGKNLHSRKDVYFFSFEDNDCNLLIKNLFYQDVYIGQIGLILMDLTEQEYFASLLNMFHYYVEKMYNHELLSGESHLEETLLLLAVKKLRGEEITDEAWDTAYGELDWNTSQPLLAILYHVNPLYDNSNTGKDVFAQTLNAEFRQNWKGVIGFQYQNDYLMIVNTVQFSSNTSRDLYQSLAYFLRDNLLVAGISKAFTNMNQLPSAACEAAAALEIGMIKAPTMWYHRFEDHVLSYIHKNSVGKLSRESICIPALLTLKEYDRTHDMPYYETLLTYFQCLLNASETAKRLCIQRSSLLYRLERIRSLTGLTLTSYEEIKYLYISFSLMEEDAVIFQTSPHTL